MEEKKGLEWLTELDVLELMGKNDEREQLMVRYIDRFEELKKTNSEDEEMFKTVISLLKKVYLKFTHI